MTPAQRPTTGRRGARVLLASTMAALIALALWAASVGEFAGAAGVRAASGPAAPPGFARQPPGGGAWRTYFPNVTLTTHHGDRVRFYDDLLRGKIVVITFMYASCTGSCPLTTRNLLEVRRRLGDRVGRDIWFYSITLMPERDGPRELKAYADAYGIDALGPGWLFLTGRPRDIELLRRKLGFAYVDRERDADRTNHIKLALLGNEPYGYWGTAAAAYSDPEQLTLLVRWLDPGSYGLQGPPG